MYTQVFLVLVFQSTPSVWRETLISSNSMSHFSFQSTPSVWRETPFGELLHSRIYISIHSLRMEGDCHNVLLFMLTSYFNPLPPYGGRLHDLLPIEMKHCISIHSLRMEGDRHLWHYNTENEISIHSLRMEGDAHIQLILYVQLNFNPLPPYGGRPFVT